jgi:predicted CxxxxCH...CXXCH cytochrome family protein
MFFLLLISCSNDADPLPNVTHPPGWTEKGSANFHGRKDLTIGSEFCTPCHGDDYSGGTSNVACADCHSDYPHPDVWSVPGNNNNHAAYIRDKYWSMDRCKTCHGADYKGGISQTSCYTCHKQPGGPEACNLCHGNYTASVSDVVSWAPPEDLYDNVDSSVPSVGAHQSHLTLNKWTTAYPQDCNLCHVETNSFDDPTHINGIVDIEFSTIATHNGRVNPEYNFISNKCSNVYCHGNFTLQKKESLHPEIYSDSLMMGNNPTMDWTGTGKNLTSCGTCHVLPPKGHSEYPNCSTCHYTVVDEDNNIINKDKHINGIIDVY